MRKHLKFRLEECEPRYIRTIVHVDMGDLVLLSFIPPRISEENVEAKWHGVYRPDVTQPAVLYH